MYSQFIINCKLTNKDMLSKFVTLSSMDSKNHFLWTRHSSYDIVMKKLQQTIIKSIYILVGEKTSKNLIPDYFIWLHSSKTIFSHFKRKISYSFFQVSSHIIILCLYSWENRAQSLNIFLLHFCNTLNKCTIKKIWSHLFCI